MQFFSYMCMIKSLEEHFTNDYVSHDEDPHVAELVRKSISTLDVGCGDNQFKKYMQNGSFIGLDLYNKNADLRVDILDYVTPIKYDLIICFGSINFYNLKWIDDRMHKIFSIWSRKSRICMKVNPNQPFASGIRLEWFDRWTTGLMNHYAEIYDCEVDEFRGAEDGRFKWDYVTR